MQTQTAEEMPVMKMLTEMEFLMSRYTHKHTPFHSYSVAGTCCVQCLFFLKYAFTLPSKLGEFEQQGYGWKSFRLTF